MVEVKVERTAIKGKIKKFKSYCQERGLLVIDHHKDDPLMETAFIRKNDGRAEINRTYHQMRSAQPLREGIAPSPERFDYTEEFIRKELR